MSRNSINAGRMRQLWDAWARAADVYRAAAPSMLCQVRATDHARCREYMRTLIRQFQVWEPALVGQRGRRWQNPRFCLPCLTTRHERLIPDRLWDVACVLCQVDSANGVHDGATTVPGRGGVVQTAAGVTVTSPTGSCVEQAGLQVGASTAPATAPALPLSDAASGGLPGLASGRLPRPVRAAARLALGMCCEGEEDGEEGGQASPTHGAGAPTEERLDAMARCYPVEVIAGVVFRLRSPVVRVVGDVELKGGGGGDDNTDTAWKALLLSW